MNVTLDETNIGRVEKRLKPLMGQTITLPVKIDDQLKGGFCVYVCQSAFADQAPAPVLEAIARYISEAVNAAR